MALDGSCTAVFLCWILKESDVKDSDSVEYMILTLWSFYRFLHFIAIKGRRNPSSEQSEIANVWSHAKANLLAKKLEQKLQ
jgi:hypothetical protein